MNTKSKEIVLFDGIPHRKRVILADVNIPYKLSIDRNNNKLFFCINADKFSDQSFQSVIFDLDTEQANIIHGVRNGFASAVNQATSDVYLGGSDGIFKYNYSTNDINKPGLINNVDIFDMYFNNNLYFIDTRTQNLHIYNDIKSGLVDETKGNLMHHFIIDDSSDIYFVNPTGLFVLSKGTNIPRQLERNNINIRGFATDVNGVTFFVTVDRIFSVDKTSKRYIKVYSVNNGNGLAFDKNNNIIYSEERSVIALFRC